MWANFRRPALTGSSLRVLETRSLLQRVTEAVPGVQITVVWLRAPLAVLHERIRSREASDPDWFLDAARHTAEVFEQAQVEDHLTIASATTAMTAPAGARAIPALDEVSLLTDWATRVSSRLLPGLAARRTASRTSPSRPAKIGSCHYGPFGNSNLFIPNDPWRVFWA